MIALPACWQASRFLTVLVFTTEWCATQEGIYLLSSKTCYLLGVHCGVKALHSHAFKISAAIS